MKFKPLAVAVLAACSIAPAFAANGLVPKQLAGSPSEFAAMQPADPSTAAIHSKSALIPLAFAVDKSGQRQWTGRLPVQDGRARFLAFSNDGSPLQIDLLGPNGQVQNAKALARQAKRAEFGMEQASVPADYYAFDGLVDGDWTIKVSQPGEGEAFLLIEGDAGTELASYPAHRKHLVGERQQIVAMLTQADDGGPALLGSDAGQIAKATLRVTSPSGSVREIAMADDGLNGDGLAGDGVYGASFVAKAGGNHLAQVLVEGRDLAGRTLLRSAEHIVPMVDGALAFSAGKAAAQRSKDGRQRVLIPVAAQGKAGGHFRAYAEVWGRDAKGAATPIAWISGMSELGGDGLALGLDERWIAKAGAQGPFELRNLRIEDPDHFVTLLGAERLDLDMAVGQLKAKPDLAVDDAMRMGQRPADLTDSAKGVGKRLLLVHGYCSGGVWPAAQFSSASTFLDANQNRSHDQFARLIQSYGSTWNSFGVVAHSQGGAASLHLYTYYWSGLDNATGNRLIQSVGTPYQGTNLSGVLAALGGIFGVGCGSNANLTYSGASAWLSGIPTWARAKVNYHTTHFRSTNWWTNDYCNFASDLVLSDPEDGTTENAYGQLPGAINRGLTSGQCHTAGMRDPAQYLDANRNATMNANAAR